MLAVTTSLILGPLRLPAQVAGVVVDPTGTPLPGALVELWNGAERRGAAVTSSDGRFRFAEAGGQSSIIVVRRIGSQPVRAVADRPALHVTMMPIAVMLAPILAGTAPRCPQRDQREARALWTAMMHRYRVRGSWGQMSVNAAQYSAIVRAEDLGTIDTALLQAGAAVGQGGSPAFLRAQRRKLGYGWRTQDFHQGWFDLWEHPLLESAEAFHFADSLFGELNNLRLVESAPDGYRLAFCSKRDKPGIEGDLDIGPDTTLRGATWIFRTPKPVEEAGGRVVFAAPESGLPYVALAIMGMFWRKRVFDYLQMWWEFRGWSDSPH
ncbi:MAG TPA: carboxypeptidase-like regulatory domain-containing protein [Gemmatimonadales bacterium]